jgi:ribosomal protein L32
VKPSKKRKAKRRTRDEILVAKYKEKQALKKAHRKQKEFINHNIDKG